MYNCPLSKNEDRECETITCAWWNDIERCCSVLSLARRLAEELGDPRTPPVYQQPVFTPPVEPERPAAPKNKKATSGTG